MFCQKCGIEITNESQKFCHRCGAMMNGAEKAQNAGLGLKYFRRNGTIPYYNQQWRAR